MNILLLKKKKIIVFCTSYLYIIKIYVLIINFIIFISLLNICNIHCGFLCQDLIHLISNIYFSIQNGSIYIIWWTSVHWEILVGYLTYYSSLLFSLLRSRTRSTGLKYMANIQHLENIRSRGRTSENGRIMKSICTSQNLVDSPLLLY